MAKKRHKPKPGTLVPVLSMKGSPEWREWLEEFANHRGVSSSETAEQALVMLAKTEGFKPPPNRTGKLTPSSPTSNKEN